MAVSPLTSKFDLYFGDSKIPENAVIPFKVAVLPHYVTLNIPITQQKYITYCLLLVNISTDELFHFTYINIRRESIFKEVDVSLFKAGNYTAFVFLIWDVDHDYVNINEVTEKIENIKQRPIPNFKQTFRRNEFGQLWGVRHFTVQAQSSLTFPELAGKHSNIIQQIIPRIENLDIADILDLCMPGSLFEREVCNNQGFYRIIAENRLTTDPSYLSNATKNEIIRDLLEGEKFALKDEDTDESEEFKAKFPKAITRLLRLGKIGLMSLYWDLFSLTLPEAITEEDRRRINLALKIFGTNTQMGADSPAERTRIWHVILDRTTTSQFNEFYEHVISSKDSNLRSLFDILLEYIPESERDNAIRRFNI